jgi:hypothetical protein
MNPFYIIADNRNRLRLEGQHADALLVALSII